jgi:hypothetical protein
MDIALVAFLIPLAGITAAIFLVIALRRRRK